MQHKAAPNEEALPSRSESTLWRNASRAACFVLVGVAVTACGSPMTTVQTAHINKETKFTSKEYGVSASKRVTTSKRVKKGGGSYKIGKPYKIRGKWYHPKEEPGYDKTGMASWYGPNFHGRKTANGEIFDQYHLSGAHPTFPLPSYARVTNTANGHSVVIRVNDRGPYAHGRIIDVSSKAADLLEMKQAGTAKVRVQYLGRARMDGRDMAYLKSSYRRNGDKRPVEPETGGNNGVMLALNAPKRAINSVFGGGTKVASLEPIGRAPRGNLLSGSQTFVKQASVKGGRIAAAGPEPLLPDVGPVPRQRPAFGNGLAGNAGAKPAWSSYVQQRVEQQAERTFAAVLNEEGGLTENLIAASWKRRGR